MAQYRWSFGLTICWFLDLSQLLADSSGLHWLLCVLLIGFVGRVGAAKKLQGYTEMGEIDTKMIDYDKLEPDLYRFAHWFSEKQLPDTLFLFGWFDPIFVKAWYRFLAPVPQTAAGWNGMQQVAGKQTSCCSANMTNVDPSKHIETPNSNKNVACIESVHYTSNYTSCSTSFCNAVHYLTRMRTCFFFVLSSLMWIRSSMIFSTSCAKSPV